MNKTNRIERYRCRLLG